MTGLLMARLGRTHMIGVVERQTRKVSIKNKLGLGLVD